MAERKSLKDVELAFLKEHIKDANFKNGYRSGFVDGSRQELDAVLQIFTTINSTSFVTAESHWRGKHNKRFSNTGMLTQTQVD